MKARTCFTLLSLLICHFVWGEEQAEVISSHDEVVLLSNGKIYAGEKEIPKGTTITVEGSRFTYDQETYDLKGSIGQEAHILKKIPFSVTLDENPQIFALVVLKEAPLQLQKVHYFSGPAFSTSPVLLASGSDGESYLIDPVTKDFLAEMSVFAERISSQPQTFDGKRANHLMLMNYFQALENVSLNDEEGLGEFTHATHAGPNHQIQFDYNSNEVNLQGDIEYLEREKISIKLAVEDREEQEIHTMEVAFGEEVFELLEPKGLQAGQKVLCNEYKLSIFEDSSAPALPPITFKIYQGMSSH